MEKINQLRKKIDKVDFQILDLFKQRVEICRTIGSMKKSLGMKIHDISRENCVYEQVKARSKKLGLDSDSIDLIYHQIVNMCSEVQT
jgi:chorismate mutase